MKRKTDLFKNFDFKVLNDKDYGEDAVREDIVAPLLRELGYSESGDNKMIRTKPLIHPFVYIGTQKRVINIFPDYLLKVKDKSVLIVDAKGPNEDITKGENVEQAYSYAIHKDVRTTYYALCNGRELSVFHINKYEPVLLISISNLSEQWEELYKIISPLALTNSKLLSFQPDFGLSMLRTGMRLDATLIFAGAWVTFVGRVSDDLYSMASSINFEDEISLATFDFSKELYPDFLKCVPKRVFEKVKNGLSAQPYKVSFDKKDSFELIVEAHLWDKTITNENEEYLPLIVNKFSPLPDARQLLEDMMSRVSDKRI